MVPSRRFVAVGGSLLGLVLIPAAVLVQACESDSSSGGGGAYDYDALSFPPPGSDGGADDGGGPSIDAASDGAPTDAETGTDSAVAVPGRALQFDYTTVPQFVTLPDSTTLDLTSAFTYEAWVKPVSSSNIQSIIAKGRGTATSDTAAIWFEGGALHAGINLIGADETVITYAWPAANNGGWHHLAFTYDDASAAENLYVDGVVVSMLTNSNGTPDYDPTHPFTIGADFDTNTFKYGFGGLIDDVRIFSSVRTPAQIASDMSGASPLGDPDLAAYLPFNEAAGTTTADLSAHHLVGSLGTNGGTTNLPTWVNEGAPH